MKKGKFIVIEGIDGSGKNMACKILKKCFNKFRIKKKIFVRQPGSTKISEKIRNILKKNNKKEKLTKYSELLLLYAARSQLLENIIKPALKNDFWVVSNRHQLSSFAYQNGGNNIKEKYLKILNTLIKDKILPNLTIYLDITPKIALKRILFRKKKIDRIEKKSKKFFDSVRNKYLEKINLDKKKIFINTNNTLKNVQKNIKHKFEKWLKKYQI
ncbi:dTMP kinase [Buchnera aphidicola]|uniref:dTMP kinase n=1 Tax=Buchnera aphidicola TaxID=9 RepID=UPI0030ECC92E